MSYTGSDGKNGMASVPVSYFNTDTSGGSSINMTYISEYIKYINAVSNCSNLIVKYDTFHDICYDYSITTVSALGDIISGNGLFISSDGLPIITTNAYINNTNGIMYSLIDIYKKGNFIIIRDNNNSLLFNNNTTFQQLNYDNYVKYKDIIDNTYVGAVVSVKDIIQSTYYISESGYTPIIEHGGFPGNLGYGAIYMVFGKFSECFYNDSYNNSGPISFFNDCVLRVSINSGTDLAVSVMPVSKFSRQIESLTYSLYNLRNMPSVNITQ